MTGERLGVMEATKIGPSVAAPIDCRIRKIDFPAREQIDAGDLLYSITPT